MAVPPGFSTINPFIISRDVENLILFLVDVFDGVEHPDARTVDHDGLLLHAELQIGGTTVMFGERKPGWPFTPSLLQVYVEDVDTVLQRARAGGADVVTEPTAFFGEVFSRFVDPWNNLWWVYSTPQDDAAGGWEEAGDGAETDAESDAESDAEWEPTPELTYIRDTLVATLPRLRDPAA
ncbi:VOC family protein [Isoptericola sp. NPDC058082]|uniref:VOC family protein n=1 Tax=Isoptericola sp. NPDC058082 TaxID=3346331 RepID=UPI0036DFA572